MDRAIRESAGKKQYRMGFLAVQEDGKAVRRRQRYASCRLGKDRGVRQAAARHRARGRTAEGPAGTGDDHTRFRRIAGECPPAKVPRESRIFESAGIEGRCCANVNLYHSLQARKLIVSCRPTVSAICWRNLCEQLGIKYFTHPSAPQFIASSSSHVADRFLHLVAREAFHRSGSAEKSRTTRRA